MKVIPLATDSSKVLSVRSNTLDYRGEKQFRPLCSDSWHRGIYFLCVAFLLFVVHTHLHLLLGWLLSGDLVCFFFLTALLLFLLTALLLFLLLSDDSLQLVVHKVFEGVQVSFSFELIYLQEDIQARINTVLILPYLLRLIGSFLIIVNNFFFTARQFSLDG